MATQVASMPDDPFNKNIYFIDPSEHCRPEGKKDKAKDEFRNYSLYAVSPLKIHFIESFPDLKFFERRTRSPVA